MTRIHKFKFRMKLWREGGEQDLKETIRKSLQGMANAAMAGDIEKADLEGLVGEVIKEVYDGDNNDVLVPGMPALPAALPVVSTRSEALFSVARMYSTPGKAGGTGMIDRVSSTNNGGGLSCNETMETRRIETPNEETDLLTQPMTVRRSPRKKVWETLVDKIMNMRSNEEQSERRGEKRGEVAVDGALMAADHANVEISWRVGKAFGCYQCPKAFSKKEKCVFVFCLTCHEEKMKKVAEMRGGNKTNKDNRRRGNRGRAAGEMEEVNVCANLNKGSCGHHTWGGLEGLETETSKAYAWREQRKKLGDNTGFIAKHCYGCGLIL